MAARMLPWRCKVSWLMPMTIRIHQLESCSNMGFLYKRCLHGRGSGSRKAKEMSKAILKNKIVGEKDLDCHKPVMVKEVISFFAPQENEVYIDMTFGGGGHTKELLKSAVGITVYGLDRDPFAYQIAQTLSLQYREQLFPLLGKFSELKDLISQHNISDVDGILIDAGCSSLQFDSPQRGFSISQDGPLDMRMDSDRIPMQPTAADVVNSLDHETLTKILHTYGEESNAKRIAQAIVDYRTNFNPFSSTSELATVIACCHSHRDAKNNKDKLGRFAHTATKTFQALRIFVNNELNELAVGMSTAWDLLKPGGKLAVLTFHSLEDRVVKRSLQGHDVAERKSSTLRQKRLEHMKENDGQKWHMVQKKVLSANDEELAMNPRARSAKLRTAMKL